MTNREKVTINNDIARNAKKSFQHIKLFLSHKLYREKCPEIRDAVGIPRGGFKDNFQAYDLWHIALVRSTENNRFQNAYSNFRESIRRLVSSMEYDQRWVKIAEQHIVFGRVTNKNYIILRSNKKTIYLDPAISVKNNKIVVTLYPNTLRKHYLNAWKNIKTLQHTLIGYNRTKKPLKKIARDRMLKAEYDKSHSVKQALDRVYHADNRDDPSEEAARIAIKRLEKRIGQR